MTDLDIDRLETAEQLAEARLALVELIDRVNDDLKDEAKAMKFHTPQGYLRWRTDAATARRKALTALRKCKRKIAEFNVRANGVAAVARLSKAEFQRAHDRANAELMARIYAEHGVPLPRRPTVDILDDIVAELDSYDLDSGDRLHALVRESNALLSLRAANQAAAEEARPAPAPAPPADSALDCPVALYHPPFSTRVQKVMTRMGCRTIRDVLLRTEDDFLDQRNFGRHCLVELRKCLAVNGHRLAVQ